MWGGLKDGERGCEAKRSVTVKPQVVNPTGSPISVPRGCRDIFELQSAQFDPNSPLYHDCSLSGARIAFLFPVFITLVPFSKDHLTKKRG